jgi:hypothetical protein
MRRRSAQLAKMIPLPHDDNSLKATSEDGLMDKDGDSCRYRSQQVLLIVINTVPPHYYRYYRKVVQTVKNQSFAVVSRFFLSFMSDVILRERS